MTIFWNSDENMKNAISLIIIFFFSCKFALDWQYKAKTPSICNRKNNFLVCIIQYGDDFYATYDFWEMLVVKAFSSLSTSCSFGSITNMGNHLSNIRQSGIGKSNAEMNIFVVNVNVVLSYNLIFIYLKRRDCISAFLKWLIQESFISLNISMSKSSDSCKYIQLICEHIK